MNNKIIKTNQTKIKSESQYTAIRTSKTTATKLKKLQILINKKDYGSVIKIDEILSGLLDSINPQLIDKLQENSMNEEDKFERDYKLYCSKTGRVTKNEFFKLVRKGMIFEKGNM